MEKKVNIRLPKGKEAKNVQFNVVDGKIEVCYDLEDKFEPKDGDFVISSTGLIFIFKKDLGDTYCERRAESYIGIERKSGNIYTNLFFVIDKGRFATEQEKSEFLERLEKECKKKWNAEKKCLEDVYVPKFGDIVKVEGPSFAFERNYSICIYPNRNEKYDQCYIGDFFDIANINLSGILCSSCGNAPVGRLHIIPASESEKQELFNKLAEVGKRWNPETKQIEDIRWTPQQNEEYWFINGGLNVR